MSINIKTKIGGAHHFAALGLSITSATIPRKRFSSFRSVWSLETRTKYQRYDAERAKRSNCIAERWRSEIGANPARAVARNRRSSSGATPRSYPDCCANAPKGDLRRMQLRFREASESVARPGGRASSPTAGMPSEVGGAQAQTPHRLERLAFFKIARARGSKEKQRRELRSCRQAGVADGDCARRSQWPTW